MTDYEKQLLARLNEQSRRINESIVPKKKPASVIGRGVVGGIIAGPVGATIGALSAIDKNNRKK